MQTAQPLAQTLGLSVLVHPDIHEVKVASYKSPVTFVASLLLVVRPRAPSSVLAPSSKATSP